MYEKVYDRQLISKLNEEASEQKPKNGLCVRTKAND